MPMRRVMRVVLRSGSGGSWRVARRPTGPAWCGARADPATTQLNSTQPLEGNQAPHSTQLNSTRRARVRTHPARHTPAANPARHTPAACAGVRASAHRNGRPQRSRRNAAHAVCLRACRPRAYQPHLAPPAYAQQGVESLGAAGSALSTRPRCGSSTQLNSTQLWSPWYGSQASRLWLHLLPRTHARTAGGEHQFDVGLATNFTQVFGDTPWLWALPVGHSGTADGHTWPSAKSADAQPQAARRDKKS